MSNLTPCFENLHEYYVDMSQSETSRMLNKKLTRIPQSLSLEMKGSASRVMGIQLFQFIPIIPEIFKC